MASKKKAYVFDEKRRMIETAAMETSMRLQEFFDSYSAFRKLCGLDRKPLDAFDSCVSMTDMLGRVARNIKHLKRSDPIAGWQEETGESLAGLVVYGILLAEGNRLDLREAFERELLKGAKQHGQDGA